MLDTLIESHSRRPRSRGATAGSLLAHCAVVVAAVAVTGRGQASVAQHEVLDYTMVVDPQRQEDAPPGPGAPLIDVPSVPVPMPSDLPSPLLPGLPDDRPPLDWLQTLGPPLVLGPDASLPGHGPVGAAQADEPPEMLVAGTPRYPELLRLAGIGGRVVVEAVIDTLGKVERGSLRVIEAAHPGFHDAAVTYVGGALFRPGRVLGRAVRVRVRLPIEFRLTR